MSENLIDVSETEKVFSVEVIERHVKHFPAKNRAEAIKMMNDSAGRCAIAGAETVDFSWNVNKSSLELAGLKIKESQQ